MIGRSCGDRELGDVVGGADQRPFCFHFLDAAQQELSEPSCLFDLSEHRLDDLLSEPVATSPSGPSELQAHGPGEATGEVALVLPGMLGPTCSDVGGDAA